LAFIAIVFGLTVAKVTSGDPMQAFDHAPRTDLLPQTAPATGD
jgi:hypothetical protein